MALEKSATVVSYGAQADAILTTARRSADAPPSDQVLVALVKEDYQLERIVDWDALGMRGTCSTGFMLKAAGEINQVLPETYQTIHTQTMMPVAHLTWSGVWSGIAAGAVERARRFVRSAARHANGQLPPGAAHVARREDFAPGFGEALDAVLLGQEGPPVHLGHHQVKQQNVRSQCSQCIRHLSALTELGHNLESFFQIEQSCEPVTEHRVIVGYHDPDRWACLLGGSQDGTDRSDCALLEHRLGRVQFITQ